MKKFIFIFFMLVTSITDAQEWESYWIAGLEDLHHANYVSAEQNFNLTISLLEIENDVEHPSIYADRARLFLILNKHENALSDINKMLLSQNLSNEERIKAVIVRFKAKRNLGITKGIEEDIEFLVNNFKIQFENTENYVIIRNMPSDKAFRESIACSFIASGMCDSEEDIKQISSDICIVNKAHLSPKIESLGAIDLAKRLADARLVESCRRWCDACTVAAISWCSNYPELRLIKACNSAVFEIQHNCRECCQTYDQDFCAQPFGNIVAVMQKYLTCPCGGN